MQVIHEFINYIQNVPASTWTTLGSYLAGSTLVATIVQVVKHKFGISEAKKLVTALLGFFSFVVATGDFLIQTNATNPLPTLGHMTGLLIGGAVVVHRFAVSPAYYKVGAKLQKLGAFLDEVSALQAQKKASLATPNQAQPLPEESNLSQFQV